MHGATVSGGDAYSVLQDFVKTADASSGEAAAPDNATHAGLCSATASGGEAAAPDDAIHAGLCSATASGDEAAAPDDAIHAGLRSATASGDAAVAPDNAIHAGLRSATALGGAAVAPDDAIHAGLRAAASGGDDSSGVVSFAKIADASGAAGPDNSIHAGLKGADNTRSDDYAALLDFAQTMKTAEPVLVAAADSKRVKVKKAVPAARTTPGFAKGDPQVCLGCHGQDPHVKGFLEVADGRKGDQRRPWPAGGCESCHGPSAAHVASRLKGGDVEPAIVFNGPHARRSRSATDMPGLPPRGERINWEGSPMQRDGVACTNCHTVHGRQGPGAGEGDAARSVLHLPRSNSGPRASSTPIIRSARAWSLARIATIRTARPARTRSRNSRSTRPATTAMPTSAGRCCGSTSRFARTA